MGNAWSEGLLTSNSNVMRYSLYGTLSKIKHEKQLQEKDEAITRKLMSQDDTNTDESKNSIESDFRRKSLRKSHRKRNKSLEPDVQAMLSTFKL